MEGIVVGADETAAGFAAARWAVEEGELRGRPVTVLRAWVDPVTLGYGMGLVIMTDMELFQRSAHEVARDVLAKADGPAGGRDATPLAVRGQAAEVLRDVSRDADLVVLGARSSGALSRAVLGSVSASVLHHAHCPVVVVPEPREPQGEPRVVVAVDHSPDSLRALAWAVDEAALRSWPLVPVLVHEPVRLTATGSTHEPDLRLLEASERAALTRAAQQFAPQVPVEPEVLTGHAARALLEFTRPDDLLVLGARGRGGFASLLLGSTSTAVAQHAGCPVVVIRPPHVPKH